MADTHVGSSKSHTKGGEKILYDGGHIAILPVRYALASNYLANGRSSDAPRLTGQFRAKPLKGETRTYTTLRRMRQGYLHVFSETFHAWSLFRVDEFGALNYIKPEEMEAQDRPEWRMRPYEPTGLIYARTDETIWLAFSDARWTHKLLHKASGEAAFRLKHMRQVQAQKLKTPSEQVHAGPLLSPDRKHAVADLDGSTRPGDFWFSPLRFAKIQMKDLLQGRTGAAYSGGAVVAMEDLPGIAMDLAMLMVGRTEQLMSRPVKMYQGPDVTFQQALTTAGAIGTLRNKVETTASVQDIEALNYVHRAGTRPMASLSDSISLNLSFGQKTPTVGDNPVPKSICDKVAQKLIARDYTYQWNRAYAPHFCSDRMETWVSTTAKQEMEQYDKDWLLPLAHAHVALVEGAPFIDHFHDTFDTSDTRSGQAFTTALMKCYLGTQDKDPCAKHIQKFLEGELHGRNLILRGMVLNDKKAHSLVLEIGQQTKNSNATLLFANAIKEMEGVIERNPAAPPTLARYMSTFLGPFLKTLRVKGDTIPPGLIAAGVAAGKPIGISEFKGPLGQLMPLIKQKMEELAVDGKCFSSNRMLNKRLSQAIDEVELVVMEKGGIKRDTPLSARCFTLQPLETTGAEFRRMEPGQQIETMAKTVSFNPETVELPTNTASLEPLQVPKNAPLLTGILGGLLQFAGLCALTLEMKNVAERDPAAMKLLSYRWFAQLGGAISSTVNLVKLAMARMGIRGLLGEAQWIQSAWMKGVFAVGELLGAVGGALMAVMDFWQGYREGQSGHQVISKLYYASGTVGAISTIAALTMLFAGTCTEGFAMAGLTLSAEAMAVVGGVASTALSVAGLVLLGIGVAIVLAQPSAIQEWLEKCCWGQNTFRDMNKEQQAFAAALGG